MALLPINPPCLDSAHFLALAKGKSRSRSNLLKPAGLVGQPHHNKSLGCCFLSSRGAASPEKERAGMRFTPVRPYPTAPETLGNGPPGSITLAATERAKPSTRQRGKASQRLSQAEALSQSGFKTGDPARLTQTARKPSTQQRVSTSADLSLQSETSRTDSLASKTPNPRKSAQKKTSGMPSDQTSEPVDLPFLEKVPPVSLQQQLLFERKGHVCLRGLLSKAEMAAFAPRVLAIAQQGELEAFRHRVAVLCPGADPAAVKSIQQAQAMLKSRGTDEVGFLQMFNLHRQSAAVQRLVASPRLAATAAELLGCKKVRLYQDCVFLKQPGFGSTNWHSDLNMVPLDTNAFVTFWLPLRQLAADDSSLLFASGSHRDFALPYWHTEEGMADLEGRNYALAAYDHLALGDATCHHGWTLHWAPEQPPNRPSRAAFTVSYFADGARVLSTKHARRQPHNEDAWSFQGWRQELKEGQEARHSLLPLVWPAQS